MLSLTFAWLLAAATPVLENEYVRVTRDRAVCATAGLPQCGPRVLVALDALDLEVEGIPQRLARGDVAVVAMEESYSIVAGGAFLEVVVKPDHPPAIAPAEHIAPDKNALRHDGGDFFIFEEKLAPGDTRERHSHSQRVVIQLNRTTLQQWPDGAPEVVIETVPDRPGFSPPVVHKVRNIGTLPLRGIIIEFRP